MSYEEVAARLSQLSSELFAVGREAERFENCRIMAIVAESCKGFSYMLDTMHDSLVEE